MEDHPDPFVDILESVLFPIVSMHLDKLESKSVGSVDSVGLDSQVLSGASQNTSVPSVFTQSNVNVVTGNFKRVFENKQFASSDRRLRSQPADDPKYNHNPNTLTLPARHNQTQACNKRV